MIQCKAETVNGQICKREATYGDFCFQHRIDFSEDDYYVLHVTPYVVLDRILKSKNLLSQEKKGENRGHNFGAVIEDNDEDTEDNKIYNKSVFTSIVFPYHGKDKIKYTFNRFPLKVWPLAYLIFKSKVIKKSIHFCPGWNFGKITERCFLYDKEKSLLENLTLWYDMMRLILPGYKKRRKYSPGELVFHDSLSLKDLECIYLDTRGLTEEQTKIMDLYPEYNWVTSDPFK